MKKLVPFILIFMCFTTASLYADQIPKRSTSDFSNGKSAANIIWQDIINDPDFQINELEFNASDVEKKAQLINLRFDSGRGIIRLDDTKLIEDDAPATGLPEGYQSYTKVRGPVEWVEDLKKGVLIKKVLKIDNPSAISARVVFKGIEVQDNKDPLHLSINGVEFIRPASLIAYPHARQYIDLTWDRWFYVDLPVESLRKGENELLMWTESDSTSWRILIAHEKEFKRGSLTRTSHPNRSMKSIDGGRTWSDSQLGALDMIDGEYSIRLSIDQYLSSGEYISPLLDLVDGDDPLKHNVKSLTASIWPELDTPEKTTAKAFVRFGAKPFIGDQWTEWEPIQRGQEISLDNKRYLQWKVELKTENPLVSPRIRGLRIRAAWKNYSPNTKSGLHAHVVNNGEIFKTSVPFGYEDLSHPGLKKFRDIHKLDQIVMGASSEFDIMMCLLNWAYRVPLTLDGYSWNWNDVTIQTKEIKTASLNSEPLTNFNMPPLNGPFFEGRRMVGMCLYPNQALIGALLSMGYQARHINIHSEGMSGHEVTEVWSNEFNKWIYLDATRDYYYFDPETGIPLNLLEIHNLLAEQMPRVELWQRPYVPDIGKEVVARVNVGMRQGNNPYPIEEGGGTYLLKTMGHFRIIPRNDFLSNPLPVPVHTGNTSWGWNGFLNWYDDIFPKRDEYQRYTNRATDFYQPLNQAAVFLSETDKRGILKVEVDTFTPGGFDTFLVKINNGDWITKNESNWNWTLRNGLNNIKVCTKNIKGVLGPVSEINVTYNP
jgi:hypothetical protein